MKLSKQTIEVLKNFNSINQGIIFKPGNVVRTMSVMKNIFASAVISDEFPKEFAVYDLGEFLSTVSLFDDPNLEFFDDYFLISEGKNKVKYFYSNPSVVVAPPNKKIAMPEPDVTFNLSKETFERMLKAAAVMKLKDFSISNELKVFNRNNVGNQYTVDVEVESNSDKFEYIIKVDNLKLIPRDYQVSVTSAGISRFKSVSEPNLPDLEYFIALEVE